MFRAAYLIFGILVIGGYGYVGWRGYEIGPSHRQIVPGGLRGASHGGYRSFWYRGPRGGK